MKNTLKKSSGSLTRLTASQIAIRTTKPSPISEVTLGR
jgi:hypothetical protein